MRPRGRFSCSPHQGKERAYVQALITAEFRQSHYRYAPVDFALFDLDSGRGGKGHRPEMVDYHTRNVPLFLYPHSARPMVQYDGIIEVYPHVRIMFTIAAGHQQVMERFGFPVPVVPCGWTLCEQKPFKPVHEIKRVLFGPVHPNANGWLPDEYKRLNYETYLRLRRWCKSNGAELTIRHVHDLQKNGLGRISSEVKTIHGLPDGSTYEIDNADLVVGHQTFAYIAIARGKPVLMMGEDMTPCSGNSAAVLRHVAHWDAYRDLLMYPLDALDGNLNDCIEKATRGGHIEKWKDLFIGQPFDAEKFVGTIVRSLEEQRYG